MSAPMTAGSEITLPPTSRYLGSRITITRTGGLTATGRLIAVAEEAIELQLDDGTVTVAPYATTTSARIADAQTAPTSEVVVCELAECEQFREWLSGEKADADKRARQAETERDTARAEMAEERARHGELVAEMQRTRTAADDARAEQVRLTEQVRVLAGLLRRGNPKVFCSKHPNHAEPGCEVCRDAGIFQSALGEQDGDQTDG